MATGSPPQRALLIYAVVAPLALVVGYALAVALSVRADITTWATLLLVFGLLFLPLLLKWHRPMLFLSWNMAATVFFFPGNPELWLVLAVVSFTLSLLQRALTADMKFLDAPSVVIPLLVLALVVYVTGWFSGGFGMRIFGSSVMGGRRYLYVFGAVLGCLAMLSQRIPPERAVLYAGLFFLGSLANAIGDTVNLVNPAFYFIYWVFPVQGDPGVGNQGPARFVASSVAALGLYCFVLARYGLRESLNLRYGWRLVLLAGVTLLTMAGGFRSALLLMAMIFALLYYFEGLVRSKYTAGLFAGALVLTALLVPFAHKLPLPMQRSLAVLPLDLDYAARLDAQASTDWRVQMWKAVLPEVPKYLWFGKGLSIDDRELELTSLSARMGLDIQAAAAVTTGNFHNGPLTILIPFGVWGAAAWLWFLAASLRALYYNYLYGDENLKRLNTFLLAYFLARAIVYFFIFGNFATDLPMFAGIIGLNLALNGGIRKPAQADTAVEPLAVSSPTLSPAHRFSRAGAN